MLETARCLYRLHVGNFPRARALMPGGGKPGETLAVRWIGDPAGDTTTTIKLPPTLEKEFGLQHQDAKGFSPLSQHLSAHYAQ